VFLYLTPEYDRTLGGSGEHLTRNHLLNCAWKKRLLAAARASSRCGDAALILPRKGYRDVAKVKRHRAHRIKNRYAHIVWENDNGAVYMWEMNGTNLIGSASLANLGATWHV
jgi:hypothetical protein